MMERLMIVEQTAPPSQHYLRCPFCLGYKHLHDQYCARCGAECVSIVWRRDADKAISPELVMVERTYFT